MSINIVIIIALAVMALVLVSFFALRGFGTSSEAITSTIDVTSEQVTGDDSGAGGIGDTLKDTVGKLKGDSYRCIGTGGCTSGSWAELTVCNSACKPDKTCSCTEIT
jgi:hypothetical protein